MMGRTTILIIAIGAVCCLLAALVSPFVPSPLPLTHGKRVADASTAAIAPAFALPTRLVEIAFRPDASPGVSLSGVEVIQMTCARIC